MLLTVTLLVAPVVAEHNPTHQAKVITHNESNAKALTAQKLRAIFTLRQQYWRDGTPIRLFVLPANHAVHQEFTRTALGLYPYQLQRSWDRLSFSGVAMGPTEVRSEQEMIAAIKTHKGAIGYINVSLSATEAQHVEVD